MSSKSIDDDLRDKMYRLKLRMLSDGISDQDIGVSEGAHYVNSQDILFSTNQYTNFDRDLKIRQLDIELRDAKKKYEKLKAKVKVQELENKISLSISRATTHPSNQQPDSISKMMEMMVLNQTQIQSMMMNQMMLTNTQHMAHLQHPSYTETQTSKQRDEPVLNTATSLIKNNKDDKASYAYPGNNSQGLMRRIGYMALFCAILDDDFEEQSLSITDKFLFAVKIQEITGTIEKHYVRPGGEIYVILNKLATGEAPNFKTLLTRSGTNEEMALAEKELNTTVQDLVTKITGIMPTFGTLGCECKSILAEFLQNKQTFPERYFFARELDLVQVDANNTIQNSGLLESQLLLIGVFFIRTLVMHELMKPVEYGLCTSLSINGGENFRILASVLTAIYITILREFVTQRYPNDAKNKKDTSMAFAEMNGFLIADRELQPLLKVVKRTMDNAKASILSWSEIYVRKLKPV